MASRRRDLRAGVSPVAKAEVWRDPEAAVQLLYQYAEANAVAAIDWYLNVKRPRKRASRLLRAAAIVLGAAGALEPIVGAQWLGAGKASWGYLMLGAAAACVAFDRFFGISTGWMRCMLAAQRLQALVEGLQYDWASSYLRSDTGGQADVRDRVALLRVFTENAAQVVRDETAQWAQEFSSNLDQFDTQAANSIRPPRT